jgi:hypothetical protein
MTEVPRPDRELPAQMEASLFWPEMARKDLPTARHPLLNFQARRKLQSMVLEIFMLLIIRMTGSEKFHPRVKSQLLPETEQAVPPMEREQMHGLHNPEV